LSFECLFTISTTVLISRLAHLKITKTLRALSNCCYWINPPISEISLVA
jgi:hypothetical protein